jgi:carbon storage regulator CsrA
MRSNKMKELLQEKGESVIVNGDICVTVLEIHDDEVVLEVVAPDWIEIIRAERDERMEECAPLLPR